MLINIESREAMPAHWKCKHKSPSQSPWKSLILAKYNPYFYDAQMSSPKICSSYMDALATWKSLWLSFKLIRPHLQYFIGDGYNVSIWWDPLLLPLLLGSMTLTISFLIIGEDTVSTLISREKDLEAYYKREWRKEECNYVNNLLQKTCLRNVWGICHGEK